MFGSQNQGQQQVAEKYEVDLARLKYEVELAHLNSLLENMNGTVNDLKKRPTGHTTDGKCTIS
jgi:hypothetical protein